MTFSYMRYDAFISGTDTSVRVYVCVCVRVCVCVCVCVCEQFGVQMVAALCIIAWTLVTSGI